MVPALRPTVLLLFCCHTLKAAVQQSKKDGKNGRCVHVQSKETNMEPPLVLIYKKRQYLQGYKMFLSSNKRRPSQSSSSSRAKERATASLLLLLFILFSKSRCCRPPLLPNTTPRSSTLIIQRQKLVHSFITHRVTTRHPGSQSPGCLLKITTTTKQQKSHRSTKTHPVIT